MTTRYLLHGQSSAGQNRVSIHKSNDKNRSHQRTTKQMKSKEHKVLSVYSIDYIYPSLSLSFYCFSMVFFYMQIYIKYFLF